MSLTPLERYAFDVRGFVVLRSGLPRATALTLGAQITRQLSTPELRRHPMEDGSVRFGGFLRSSAKARALLDQDPIHELLDEIVGAEHRLDHLYGIHQPPGTGKLALHGGAADVNPAVFYRSEGGRIRTGLTVVSWALTDQPAEVGGFVCVPGSHKATVELPGMYAAHAENRLMTLEEHPGLLVSLDLRAGDALVFTEALCHGAREWRGDEPRLSLLFKYCPRDVSWSAHTPAAARDLALFTPRQRTLFAAPTPITAA